MNKYDDIINLEHPEPKNHVRMPIESRAAQFSPFSALSGYEKLLKETRRVVDFYQILSDDKKELLDRTLKEIENDKNKKVKITYFIKDKRKDGGMYKTIITKIKKINYNNKSIVTDDNIIYLKNIKDIEILEE